MTFWSNSKFEPLRRHSFEVTINGEYAFLAKSVNKPTLETDVNEYRLINQIKKFPTIPKWNDITIKYVDSVKQNLTEKLMKLMLGSTTSAKWKAKAIKNDGKLLVVITQYDSNKEPISEWHLKGAFIKSIDYGNNDYSSDDLLEVTVVVAYDWAYLDKGAKEAPITATTTEAANTSTSK